MNILVTGAKGFVGTNLCMALKNIAEGKDCRERYQPLLPLTVYEFDINSTQEELSAYCANTDFVFNFAGINRPEDPAEFQKGNYDFLDGLLDLLKHHNNKCTVMLSSSIQASLKGRHENSAYGESKLAGEELLFNYSEDTGATVLVYRFPNLFGKWCRPGYNSAVATFCDAIANEHDYTINDPGVELELLYIDDLVTGMLEALIGNIDRCCFTDAECLPSESGKYCFVPGAYRVTLGVIESFLLGFKSARHDHSVPDVTDGSFSKKLYSTYLSYLNPDDNIYKLKMNVDERGSFTEILHTIDRGQVSVNVSRPGVIKGQHWHNSKWEKFCVVSGEGLIQLRRVGKTQDGEDYPVYEYYVSGNDASIVEMIPGYTHNIINLSDSKDLITVMWCNESFNPNNPDTYYCEV